jgi:hypothetical protein
MYDIDSDGRLFAAHREGQRFDLIPRFRLLSSRAMC